MHTHTPTQMHRAEMFEYFGAGVLVWFHNYFIVLRSLTDSDLIIDFTAKIHSSE